MLKKALLHLAGMLVLAIAVEDAAVVEGAFEDAVLSGRGPPDKDTRAPEPRARFTFTWKLRSLGRRGRGAAGGLQTSPHYGARRARMGATSRQRAA